MPIVVEDGSIVDGANSYASIDDLYSYASMLGVPFDVCSDTVQNLLLRSAHIMETKYSLCFLGDKVSSTQPMDWPRSNVWVNGELVSNTTIPRDIYYGQMNIALESYTSSTISEYAVKREKFADMEIEYDTSTPSQIYSYSTSSAKIRTYCRNVELVRS